MWNVQRAVVLGIVVVGMLSIGTIWFYSASQTKSAAPSLRNAAAATRLRERTTLTSELHTQPTPSPALESTIVPVVAAAMATGLNNPPALTGVVPTEQEQPRASDGTNTTTSESKSLEAPTLTGQFSSSPTSKIVLGISFDKAQRIVMAFDSSAKLLRPAERVLYHDIECYEFVLDHGTIYVAERDGSIVYNGIAVVVHAEEQATVQPALAVATVAAISVSGLSVATAGVIAAPPIPTALATVILTSTERPTTSPEVLTATNTPVATGIAVATP